MRVEQATHGAGERASIDVVVFDLDVQAEAAIVAECKYIAEERRFEGRRELEVRDRADLAEVALARHALQVGIVEDDDLARRALADVELDRVGALGVRALERG